jgi:putative lipoic acid-binding regulatory protein
VASGVPPVELLESTHDFPGEYMLKAFGPHEQTFVDAVTEAVSPFHSRAGSPAVSARASSKGTYICVTAAVWLDDAGHVEPLYAAVRQVDGLKRML